MKPPTHDQLCARAARWLSNTRKCGLVLKEPRCWSINEFPDAIGWKPNGYSILVECKTSVSDFRKDKHKPCHRSPKESMGRERWYLTPAGLLDWSNILTDGWGVLELHGRSLRVIDRASCHERPGREAAELPLLINAARRQAWDRDWNWKGPKVRLECQAPG